ncbi:MAG: hypothetical protein M3Q95_00940 [Bacteroidota bacterium]|nr:hypothetical protein [Bacteroidota bacterium]
MKAIQILAAFSLIIMVNHANGQERGEVNLADSTGLPGDHFSLQGALGIFKESKSLEDFEKRINTKDNSVNNLDLNGDGKIDYVKVIDISKDEAHAVVLQVPVSKTETQDVAVIELEKNGESSAMIQIVGDEALYAKNTIVEPAEIAEPTDNGNSKRGPSAFSPGAFIVFNVWGWPCVRYMYAPVYVEYMSPWYWGYYPGWWSPWAPYPWSYHYMNSYHYHHHYHYAPYHRTEYAHRAYAPRRNHSAQVTNRYRENHVRYNSSATSRPARSVSGSRPSQLSGSTSRPKTYTKDPQSKPGAVKPSQVKPATRTETTPQTRPSAQPRTSEKVKPGMRPKPAPLSRPSQQSRPMQSKPSNQRGR